MQVENMTSRKGNKVSNQFIIRDRDNGTVYFQSYARIIVKQENGKTYLDTSYWDYSKTTGKYRNLFLCENKAETLKKIESGEYILTDLN